MFQKAKNINQAFQYIRSFTILIVIGSIVICLFCVYKSYIVVTETQKKVYVMANGKVLEAFASDRKDNLAVEARDHIRVFHEYFFSLDPDEKVINTNISKALYLADASAKKTYDDLRENGFYAGLVSGNISQAITVDSIALDLSVYPFAFRCYCKQQIVRTTTISLRSLTTEGFLRNVSRSDNNPHGFLIERWHTLENRDLKAVNR